MLSVCHGWGLVFARFAAGNLRFLASSRDFKPPPRDAPSGLLRLPRESHQIRAKPARAPQTLRNATSPQGTQGGGEAHIDFQSSACLFQSCTCCSKLRMRSSISWMRSALFCTTLPNVHSPLLFGSPQISVLLATLTCAAACGLSSRGVSSSMSCQKSSGSACTSSCGRRSMPSWSSRALLGGSLRRGGGGV